MNARKLSRFLVIGVLSMSTAMTSAFAQTPAPVPTRVTVQQMKAELDKLSPAEREEALKKAYLDADSVRQELAKAQARLEFEKTRSGGDIIVVAGLTGIAMVVTGFNAYILQDLVRMGETYSTVRANVMTGLFIGSTLATAGIIYAAKKDADKQRDIRLSKVEIVRAMDKLQSVQDLLEVEMARIDLLRNYYGVTVK